MAMQWVDRLTRRSKRRIFVVLMGGLVGLSVPLWVPRLLASLPAFRVATVEVVGTRYVPPTDVIRLAAVEPDASVWDDPTAWETRVEAHPLVLEARVRRDGSQVLEIQVIEDRPVALASTPMLLPVSAEGRVLPLDPWAGGVDLPLISGHSELEGGRLADPAKQAIATLISRLETADPEFVQQVSEVGYAEEGGYEFHMLPTANANRVVLPVENPEQGLRRVALALGQISETPVPVADARYASRVVLSFEENR